MLHYRFRLKIYGQTLGEGFRLALADEQAALKKARQIAQALLDFGDRTIPWTEAMLVIESSDGREVIDVPVIDLAENEAKAPRH